MVANARTPARWTLLLGLLAVLGCGGGAGSWSFQPDEGEWLVDMTIQTSGCAPTIMRQFHADVVDMTSDRSAVVIYLETFYDCPRGEWRLPGTWISSELLGVDDQGNTRICQFEDRWGIGLFSITGLDLDFPAGGEYFSGSGAFSGDMDGTPCSGTISFVGVRP